MRDNDGNMPLDILLRTDMLYPINDTLRSLVIDTSSTLIDSGAYVTENIFHPHQIYTAPIYKQHLRYLKTRCEEGRIRNIL